jgi:hypothetical protein
LRSDLKGYIERPNYYFTKESDEVNKALDNLMLTQGYRRFAWKELDKTVNTKPAFEAEKLGFKVTGRVTTLTNELLSDAQVILNSVIAGTTKVTTTDAHGRFTFDGIFLPDSLKFAVQARGKNNSDKVKIILDEVPKLQMSKNPNLGDVSTNVSETLKEYIENGKKLDDVYEQSGQLDKVHRLKEVRIKARKPALPPYANQGFFRIPEWLVDQTFMMEGTEKVEAALGTWLNGKLRAVTFMPLGEVAHYPYGLINGGLSPLRVILNGRHVEEMEEISNIFDGGFDSESIYKIDIIRLSTTAKLALNGPALMIFTKRGYIRRSYTPSITNVSPKGFNKVREFYTPRYDNPNADSKLPDLRTTVYWNPYLKSDANGKTTFEFFNADGPSSYKVVVEGINAEGQLARQIFKYGLDYSEKMSVGN